MWLRVGHINTEMILWHIRLVNAMSEVCLLVEHLFSEIVICSFESLGDFMIRNETVESKVFFYHWPRVHRLEYKIQNHDDLLSFAQIDIVDTDVGHSMWKLKPLLIFPLLFLMLTFACLGAPRGAYQHRIELLWNLNRQHKKDPRNCENLPQSTGKLSSSDKAVPVIFSSWVASSQ